ncbi:MAG: zinc metallopeptidase [Bacteroidales bacterium]|nr:zinc metallopeptidase [Bacteroidales bacterium]
MNIWLIMILVMLASYLVQATLNAKFDKYSKVPNRAGLTGADVARKMLKDCGVEGVEVTCIGGRLTDHFNPKDMTVNLSEGVYHSNSIAAAAIAAHECGHAIQHAQGYAPLRMRSALVPVVSFSSSIVQWVLLAGVFMVNTFPAVLWAGIILFAFTTLFSLVTLPVEIDASSRAVMWLEYADVAEGETRAMAKDALKWAAYTYVIAALGSLATLFYYISLANNRRS